MTRVSVFHPSLLVHYNASGGIGRTLSQKISHRAIELVPVGKPVVESLLTGILAITTTNEYNFHRHHLLHLLSKKKPEPSSGFDKGDMSPSQRTVNTLLLFKTLAIGPWLKLFVLNVLLPLLLLGSSITILLLL